MSGLKDQKFCRRDFIKNTVSAGIGAFVITGFVSKGLVKAQRNNSIHKKIRLHQRYRTRTANRLSKYLILESE